MEYFQNLNSNQEHIYVLAEIGINHDGDIKNAKNLITSCKDAGADGVKFQLIHPNTLLNSHVYEENNKMVNPVLSIFKKYILNDNDYIELANYCEKTGIDFLCTCFDEESVDLIDPYVKAHKIASGDITHIPLLKHIGSKNKPVILSTGMSDIHIIRQAVNAIKDGGGKQIILLHCVSLYPPKDNEVNLNAIKALHEEFELLVGFSDHSHDDLAAICSYCLGGRFIEKHVTYNKKALGADHAMSMEIQDFEQMISKLRRIQVILGKNEKKEVGRETIIAKSAFRGVYAKINIKKGDIFSKDNVLIARPSSCLKPIDFYTMDGKPSLRNIEAGDEIIHGDF